MKSRLLTVIPLLLIAVIFCSCAGGSRLQKEDMTAITEEENTEAEITDISLSGYTVIRPDNQSYEFNPSIALYKALNSEFGDTNIATDWVKDKSTIPAQAKEILVGNTNRPENISNAAALKVKDWRIEYFPESGRIAITGGSEEAIAEAVNSFVSKYVSGKGVTAVFPSNLLEEHITDLYTVKKLSINGTPVENYQIVIPAISDNDEQYAADVLKNGIEAQTGYNLSIVTEKYYETGAAIFVGKTSALKKAGLVSEVSAKVTPKDGVLFVYGEGGYEVAAAKRLISSFFAEIKAEIDFRLEKETVYTDIVAKVNKIEELGELPVAVVDQKNACAAIYDVAPVYRAALKSETASPVLKYSFAPTNANGFKLNGTYGNRIDDFRIRYSEKLGCYIMLFTSSSGYVGIAEYPSGKFIWSDSLSGYGPHSIEYLPNGLVALALSGNGDESKAKISVSKIDEALPIYGSKLLNGCHAVLWDEVRGILWGWGSSNLIAMEIDDSGKTPALSVISNYSCTASLGGHDMSAVPGDSDLLILSGSSGAVFVNKASGKTFSLTENSMKVNSIKCLSVLPTLESDANPDKPVYFFIRTYAQDVYASHDTDNFDIFWGTSLSSSTSGHVKITLSERAFYKVRALDYSYCPDLP